MRKKKLVAILLASVLSFGILPVNMVWAGYFKDVPETHWAYQDIEQAKKLDILSGNAEGLFKMGEEITKAEFISLLVRMMGWKIETPGIASFTDVDKTKWYYSAIETALKNGIIEKKNQIFLPEEPITREELAVILIKALNYDTLTETAAEMETSFSDLSSNKGYLILASDFGLMNGKTETTFEPDSTVKKEEAVSILMRAYRKTHEKLDFLHGFYAFSSYAQKEMAAEMDSISYGWSRLDYDFSTGVVLNTTSENNNEWRIPIGYEEVTNEMKNAKVRQHLNVYLSASTMVLQEDGNKASVAKVILTDSVKRAEAIQAIVDELNVIYQKTGYNPYSGVTIDFENMKGIELKEGFILFLTQLKAELSKMDKTLYVAVHPVLSTGAYYDAYDYYTIGQLADKVILMAHDYQATSLTEEEMASGFTTTPVSPFDQVYFALKKITDGNTGVQDKSKIVLAVSINTVGWSQKGRQITNSNALTPAVSLINEAGKSGGMIRYSDRYRNPSITYNKDGETLTVWYEDSRSIEDKIMLAQMFGIEGLSIWRVGLIPNYKSESQAGDTYLDIWRTIKNYR